MTDTHEFEIDERDEAGDWVSIGTLVEFVHNRRLISSVDLLDPAYASPTPTLAAVTENGPVPAGTVVRLRVRTVGEWRTLTEGPVIDIDTVRKPEENP